MRRALRATVRAAERRLEPAGQAASELVERARGYGEALLADRPRGWPLERRPPIQRSIDVAVPLELAWDEWMRFEFLPEGAHRVQGIERDGDGRLFGRLSGLKPGEWEAEVLDERQDESFAWRSVQGSDCAGLLTFHRLGPRLTRLELQLDVVPSGFTDAAALLLHLADRRAEADLRRFKSRLETINPDEYPSLDDEEAAEETEERWQ